MITPKRLSSTAHTVALACAIALLAVGCASSTAASSDAVKSASNSSLGSGSGEVPATTYLSVAENYFPNATEAPTPGKTPLRFDVTDQQTIARLAALIDALPTAPQQNIITPCPSSLAPAYELDFQDAKNTMPVAEISIECFGVMVTVHGQSKPILSGVVPDSKVSLLSSVGSLLAASGTMPAD